MPKKESSVSSDSNSTEEKFLGSIKKDHEREKSGKKDNDAVRELLSLINSDRNVGDLISMDYGTAEVLIHDRLRQDVGGVPHGCLLLATRVSTEDESLDLHDARTSMILLRVLKGSTLPNDVEMKQARLQAGQRAADTSDNWDGGGQNRSVHSGPDALCRSALPHTGNLSHEPRYRNRRVAVEVRRRHQQLLRRSRNESLQASGGSAGADCQLCTQGGH